MPGNPQRRDLEVSGAGQYIYYTADAFRYLYQQISGNCTIVARITSLKYPDTIWDQAGVMMRATLDPSAPNAFMAMGWINDVYSQFRSTESGSTTQTSAEVTQQYNSNDITQIPYWLEIVRTGSNLTCYYSSDNNDYPANWTQIGATTAIAMTDPIYVGLAITGGNTTMLATALFDNVSIINGSPCATPTFSPAAGTFATSTAVTISTTTSGATIRYTTNGTTPSSRSARSTAARSPSPRPRRCRPSPMRPAIPTVPWRPGCTPSTAVRFPLPTLCYG